jgi:hypothetical protein
VVVTTVPTHHHNPTHTQKERDREREKESEEWRNKKGMLNHHLLRLFDEQ